MLPLGSRRGSTSGPGGSVKEYRARALNIPRTSYLSFSKLKIMQQGPEFIWAQYGMGRKPEPTQAMLDGQRLDLLLTDPPAYKRRTVIMPFPDFTSFESRRWRDETRKENPECFIINEKQAKADRELQDSVLSHPEVAAIMAKINWINHGYATCPEFGLWYFIPDLLTLDGFIGDFKAVESVDADAFNRQQFYEQWYVQLSLYGYLDSLITGRENIENKFYIAFEKRFPYRCRVYTLTRDYERMGEVIWRKNARELRALLDADPTVQNRRVWFQAGYEIQNLAPEYRYTAYNADFKNLPLGG